MVVGLYLCLVIVYEGCFIGDCMLFNWLCLCCCVEIGYLLGWVVWGKGLMIEVLMVLIDFGFGLVMVLNCIEVDIDLCNIGLVKVLECFGFMCEGFLWECWIVVGEVFDSVFYGLL